MYMYMYISMVAHYVHVHVVHVVLTFPCSMLAHRATAFSMPAGGTAVVRAAIFRGNHRFPLAFEPCTWHRPPRQQVAVLKCAIMRDQVVTGPRA